MNKEGEEGGNSTVEQRPIEQEYLQVFKPLPGAVRAGGRFRTFSTIDYSIQVRMTNSTGTLGRQQ